MAALKDFLNTTIVGGLVFRVPLVVLVIVLVNVEGGWQPGDQLEPLQAGWVAVFLPQAPSPRSGNILYMPAGKD